ncbi:centromere protein K [Chiloscyllium plagiosum]|uniref:centromere protein K n=1 Tax=Chiloscyllium plagiosum TaxID=36176 RepID=UPI001CB7FABF|nr:centromere protein K [Chiloscyllium plagiosum]XP_043535978.1 centromere protein K [Chiloscyllium plagiosum]
MDLQDQIMEEAKELARRSLLYQSHLPPPLVNAKSLSDTAEEEVLEECNEAWRELGEFQNKLTLADIREVVQDSENPLAVLFARERALQAELSVQKNRTPKPLLANHEVLTCLGKQELQNTDKQLEMILSCIRTRKKSLQEELAREQKWLEEQLELEKTVQEKFDHQQQNLLAISKNSEIQKLKSRLEKVTNQKDELLSALGKFLDVHYPPPSEKDIRPKTSRSAAERYKGSANFITLHEILELLITKAMKSPHDPYLELDDTFWPPFLEALLRYGVVLRHPDDPHRIRLEEFNQ